MCPKPHACPVAQVPVQPVSPQIAQTLQLEYTPASTPVAIRPEIAALPAYIPGADASDQAIKLSSNENPFPPIPEVVAAMTQALLNANRYPQMTSQNLAQALARHHNVPPSWIVVEDGSVAVLARALTTVCTPGTQVVMAWRSFEAYPITVQATGATCIQIPLTPQGEHDLPAMAAAVGPQTRAVIICSPNNPTGTSVRASQLQDFLAAIPPQVLVILDEAYIDFDGSPERPDGIELVRTHPNVISLRTFSKASGLAGVRVGYALAQEPLAAPVRAVSTPFAVNIAGQAGALAALQYQEIARTRVHVLTQERNRVVSILRSKGWKIPQTNANFFWIPGKELVQPITTACAQAQIVVRPFPDGVRITISTRADNDRVIAALSSIARN